MRRATVYLPDELKAQLVAVARGAALGGRHHPRVPGRGVGAARPPDPRILLRHEGLGRPDAATNVDELLDGFGAA